MIDTHSHLFAEEFADDLPQVIERAKAAGVRKVFMPNIDDTTIRELLEVCEAYKGFCYPMLGFHPTSVDGDYKARLMPMKKLLTEGHPYIAIGEVGMDLYWDKTYLKEQQAALDEQIHWALEYDLPLFIFVFVYSLNQEGSLPFQLIIFSRLPKFSLNCASLRLSTVVLTASGIRL